MCFKSAVSRLSSASARYPSGAHAGDVHRVLHGRRAQADDARKALLRGNTADGLRALARLSAGDPRAAETLLADAARYARSALIHLEQNLGHDQPLTRQAQELANGSHGS